MILFLVSRRLLQIPRRGPWNLSFAYGRALQQSALRAWAAAAAAGDDTQAAVAAAAAAQRALLARAQANGEANLGRYVPCSQPSDDTPLFASRPVSVPAKRA